MTLNQFKFIFELNGKILIENWRKLEFKRHCERIMRHPAERVHEALQKAVKLVGNDKPRLYYIKMVHDILLELEKKEFQKPMGLSMKSIMNGMP